MQHSLLETQGISMYDQKRMEILPSEIVALFIVRDFEGLVMFKKFLIALGNDKAKLEMFFMNLIDMYREMDNEIYEGEASIKFFKYMEENQEDAMLIIELIKDKSELFKQQLFAA